MVLVALKQEYLLKCNPKGNLTKSISEKQTKCKGSQEKNLLRRASNWIISNSFIPCKPYMLELINSFQHLE